MDGSTPDFLVLYHLLKLAQTHVHWVGDAMQPSHLLSSPSPPAFNFVYSSVCLLIPSSQFNPPSPFPFGNLMWRANSLEKTLMLGKIAGRRRRDDRGWDGWVASPTQWTWVWANSRRWWWTGKPGVLQSMGSQRVRHDWVTEQQQRVCTYTCGFPWWLKW